MPALKFSFFRRPASSPSSTSGASSDDPPAGPYASTAARPENLAFQTNIALRVLWLGLVLSIALNAALAAALISLAPLRQVIPYPLQVHDGQVVSVRPLNVDRTTASILLETELRTYVEHRQRVIPNLALMTERWSPAGFVGRRSSRSVYADFSQHASSLLQSLQNQPFIRNVDILNVNQTIPNTWTLQFRTTERPADPDDDRTVVRYWIAYVTIQRIAYDGLPTRDQVLANPLGFVVTEYRLDSEKSDTDP